MNKCFFILILITVFISCKKENPELTIPDAGYNYYPLTTGTTNYYEVTEINIDQQLDIYDTVRYLLKTVLDTPYYDNENKLIYPISRYKTASGSVNWVISDVWYAYLKMPHLVISEENVHILKFVFPLEEGKEWNGNVYNTTGEQDFIISDYEIPYTLNGILYDTTLNVIEKEDTSLIHKYYRFERYSKGIGLIECTDINISSAEIFFGVPIEQRIKRGTIYRQKRIEL